MDVEKTGAYLAMLRKAKGLTQQEIADRLGVSNKTISKWEQGGGFPDITVLPALAELYGVTADDILAGETLTARRRETLDGTLTAQKKQLLNRLRLRFDVCFVLSLALAAVAWLNIAYISPACLILSPAALWIGYLLITSPLRDELPTERQGLAPGLWRKLAVGTVAQWAALLNFPTLPSFLFRLNGFRFDNFFFTCFYLFLPQLFLVGALLLWGLFQLLLRHHAGRDAHLVPAALTRWFLWGSFFLILWQSADALYSLTSSPLEAQLAMISGSVAEEYAVFIAKQLRPYELAKRAVLTVGFLSGLGLAVFQLKKRFHKKAVLAQTDES